LGLKNWNVVSEAKISSLSWAQGSLWIEFLCRWYKWETRSDH
jgi:hypothetical protein